MDRLPKPLDLPPKSLNDVQAVNDNPVEKSQDLIELWLEVIVSSMPKNQKSAANRMLNFIKTTFRSDLNEKFELKFDGVPPNGFESDQSDRLVNINE